MDSDIARDHQIYRDLLKKTVRKLEEGLPHEELQSNIVYRCYHSMDYFQEKYPNPQERRAFVEDLQALRHHAWLGAQRGAEECRPILLGDQWKESYTDAALEP